MQLCWKNFLELLLSQYYRWIKEKGSMQSLKSWVTGLLKKLSNSYKHQKLSMFAQCWKYTRKELNQVLFRDRRRET